MPEPNLEVGTILGGFKITAVLNADQGQYVLAPIKKETIVDDNRPYWTAEDGEVYGHLIPEDFEVSEAGAIALDTEPNPPLWLATVFELTKEQQILGTAPIQFDRIALDCGMAAETPEAGKFKFLAGWVYRITLNAFVNFPDATASDGFVNLGIFNFDRGQMAVAGVDFEGTSKWHFSANSRSIKHSSPFGHTVLYKPLKTHVAGVVAEYIASNPFIRSEFSSLTIERMPAEGVYQTYRDRIRYIPDSIENDLDWVEVDALENDWRNFGQGFQGVRYRKVNGVVHLEGVIVGGGIAPGITVFTLPHKYRPDNKLIFAVEHIERTAMMTIYDNGNVEITSGQPREWTSINVSYFVGERA